MLSLPLSHPGHLVCPVTRGQLSQSGLPVYSLPMKLLVGLCANVLPLSGHGIPHRHIVAVCTIPFWIGVCFPIGGYHLEKWKHVNTPQ